MVNAHGKELCIHLVQTDLSPESLFSVGSVQLLLLRYFPTSAVGYQSRESTRHMYSVRDSIAIEAQIPSLSNYFKLQSIIQSAVAQSYGKLSSRDMRLFMNHCVRLAVTSNTLDESNAVMDAVRIRISPCQQQLLLYRRMKEVLMDEKLSDKVLKALFVCAEKNFRPVENS